MSNRWKQRMLGFAVAVAILAPAVVLAGGGNSGFVSQQHW